MPVEHMPSGIFAEMTMDLHDYKDFDHFADERDFQLLEKEKSTFFVLARILGGECKLLLTDHKRLIICFSCSPYPVWIWMPDDVTPEEKQRAYDLIKDNGLLAGERTFNVKHEFAAYLIERAAQDARMLSIQTNMLAYDCPSPIEPHMQADGGMRRCASEDVDELTELTDFFHRETGIDQGSLEAYRRKSEEAIQSGNVFFWRNAEGRNVAVCSLRMSGEMACVGLVFTREEYRRRHYAENLVFEVTKMAKAARYIPMLYTDADYVASNSCYKKLGYVLRGSLCTVGSGIGLKKG